MHEYSITCSIVKILEDVIAENKIEKIKQVDFEINDFSAIEPDSIKFYYDFLTKDNEILKNAELSFKKINPEMKCLICNKSFIFKDFNRRCPECNSSNIRFKDIDDIKIISVHTNDMEKK
jgi:hydrogenase nickel incorporation protein HypA/HybF